MRMEILKMKLSNQAPFSEACLYAVKVEYEAIVGYLPSELHAESIVAEKRPELLLCFGHGAAQFAGTRDEGFCVVGKGVGHGVHRWAAGGWFKRPHPGPLLNKERVARVKESYFFCSSSFCNSSKYFLINSL